MYIPKQIVKFKDKLFDPIAKFSYERFSLKPDVFTVLSLLLSLVAAGFFYSKFNIVGMIFLALSLFADGIDGTIARKYNLASKKGELKDDISDRASELVLFIAFVLNGSVTFMLAALAYFVIILGTILRRVVKIDLGFKRLGLFIGPFFGFVPAFIIILIVNSICLAIQLIVIIWNRFRTYFF